MAFRRYLAEEVAEDCAAGLLTRREALRRLSLFGISAATATTLLAACGDDDSNNAASSSTRGDADTTTTAGASDDTAEVIRFAGPAGELIGAFAPASQPKGAVLLVHENRGLTPHFLELPKRFAADGYSALCVDLASAKGGTASLDEAGAQAALADAAPEQLVADLGAGIEELQRRTPGAPVAAVGFCFGGGMVWQLLQAGESRVVAAVPFYGPAPDAPDFSKARAAVLAIYGETDTRVNASRERAEAALKAAGLVHEIRTFPGAGHAFFNDTGDRYNATAATEAYAAVLAWFSQHLR